MQHLARDGARSMYLLDTRGTDSSQDGNKNTNQDFRETLPKALRRREDMRILHMKVLRFCCYLSTSRTSNAV